jgi:crossover junction endodeoxyribonuclease RuvC
VIVLGVDPGMAALGWGVVTFEGGRLAHVAHGVLKTERRTGLSRGRDLAARAEEMGGLLGALLDRQRPAAVGIEAFAYYGKPVPSALQLANVCGAVREAARARGMILGEYRACDWHRAIFGTAKGTKAQVAGAVARALKLAENPRPEHAADALAVAICHALRAPFLAAVARGR